MPLRLRPVALALCACVPAVMACASDARAQADYPVKPIRVVIAFAPGGIADTAGRLVSQKLSERLGQPVVVENRGGAGGLVAAKAVAAMPADGYSLLVHTAAIAVNISGSREATDVIDELAPVALTATTPTVFVINASAPARTVAEFARGLKDGRFSYSSAGVGTTPQLTADYVFRVLSKLDPVHVPFQGGAPAITAVLAGQVDMVTTSMPPAVPFIRQGKMRALAVAASKRSAALPDVPTLAEQGLPDFEDLSWVAFLAPAKTPREIVTRLNREINAVLELADVRERLAAIGFEPYAGSADAFGDYLRKEVAKWARVVRETGAKAQ